MNYNRQILTVAEIGKRYPNICRNVRFLAHLTSDETRLVVWAAKNRIPRVGGRKVAVFGGPLRLVAQASQFKARNA